MPLRVVGLWREVSTGDLGHQLIDRRIGECDHLVVGAILDRVRNEEPRGIKTKRRRLGFGSTDEWVRSNEDAWKAAALKVGDVMHTA